jgi:hypothetical protein
MNQKFHIFFRTQSPLLRNSFLAPIGITYPTYPLITNLKSHDLKFS